MRMRTAVSPYLVYTYYDVCIVKICTGFYDCDIFYEKRSVGRLSRYLPVPTRRWQIGKRPTRTAEPRRPRQPRQPSARADTSEWQLPTRSHNRSHSTSPTRKCGRSGYEDSNDFARPRDSQRSRRKSKSTP